MAEGTTHTDRTVLSFEGRIDRSLGGAAQAAENALGRIGSASAKASTQIESNFARASRSMQAFGSRINTGALLLGGAGIAAGLYAAGKAVEFFHAAIEASTEEGGARLTRLLTLSLSNIPVLAKRGTDAIHEQVVAIGEIGEKMQHVSGTSAMVYEAGYQTLIQYGATKREISALSGPMADYLAMVNGVKASQEDSVQLANKIGAAIDTRKLGRFARELGITPDQQKAWKALTSNFQRMEFLATAIEKRFKGAAASQGGTAAGRLSEIEAEQTAIMAKYGDSFKVLDARWKTLVLKMETALLPLAGPLVDAMVKGFDTIEAAGTKFFSKLSTGTDVWKKYGDSIKAVMDAYDWDPVANAKALEQVASVIVNYFNAIGERVDKIGAVFNTMQQQTQRIVNMLGGHISAEDTAAIIKDQQARASRGGQAIGDRLGTFPDSPEERRRIEDNARAVDENTRRQKAFNIASSAAASATRTLEAAANSAAIMLNNIGANTYKGMQMGGMSGSGSAQPLTEYGPAVDPPGSAYYDSDSYHHIGHIGGVPYSLSEGDAAMKADYARKHYHIEPGGSYISDKDHKLHRWRDTTGASNPINEDIFRDKPSSSSKPASGHTINAPTTIHVHGSVGKSELASIGNHLTRHTENLLDMLKRADDEDARRALV